MKWRNLHKTHNYKRMVYSIIVNIVLGYLDIFEQKINLSHVFFSVTLNWSMYACGKNTTIPKLDCVFQGHQFSSSFLCFGSILRTFFLSTVRRTFSFSYEQKKFTYNDVTWPTYFTFFFTWQVWRRMYVTDFMVIGIISFSCILDSIVFLLYIYMLH